jgi:hypothetical protein
MQIILDIAGQLAGQWAKTENLDPNATELFLEWSKDHKQIEWGQCRLLPPDTPKADLHFNISLAGGQAPTKDGKYTILLPVKR